MALNFWHAFAFNLYLVLAVTGYVALIGATLVHGAAARARKEATRTRAKEALTWLG